MEISLRHFLVGALFGFFTIIIAKFIDDNLSIAIDIFQGWREILLFCISLLPFIIIPIVNPIAYILFVVFNFWLAIIFASLAAGLISDWIKRYRLYKSIYFRIVWILLVSIAITISLGKEFFLIS